MFHRSTRPNRSLATLALAAGFTVLLGVAPSAIALPPTAEARGGLSRTVISNNNEDGRKVTLELEGSKVVKATVDGKKIGSDKVKVEGDQIIIIGEDGKEIVRLAKPGTAGFGSGNSWIVTDRFGDPKMAQAMKKFHSTFAPADMSFPVEPPRVMLGVLMTEAEGPLAEHFGLTADQATVITTVNPDMPAGKAGIKPYDIVIAVDGKSPAGMKAFREAMSKKSPDDTVTFKIISAGQRKDVTVKLVKFDADKLREAFPHEEMKDEPMTIEPGVAPRTDMFPPGSMPRAWAGAQNLPGMALTHDRELEKKLSQLDERLQKLEAMLQRLVERKP